MKKFAFMLAGLFLAVVPALAGEDRPITVGELPSASQQFLKTHFKDAKVSYASVDREITGKDYKVVFEDGSKVEFGGNGAWTDVEVRTGAVPAAIVPQQIRDQVAEKFPNRKIRSIERDRRGYDVHLDNGLELEFDGKFRMTKIDD